jgi:acetate kinase
MSREYVLVLNAGSSSLKYGMHERTSPGSWQAAARGKVEGIGMAALGVLMARLGTDLDGARILGVGHRVVHGGPRHAGPVVITPEVLAELRGLAALAPLHQPHNLAVIDALGEQLPGVPQVACFDTSFHRGQPAVAEVVPLPREIRDAGVQRYGFHGISCEYIASVLPEVAPAIGRGRVIVAHLGSGASLCALRDGRSVDSTFGFSPLDGLCMGTRPGHLDPGIVLYLFQVLGLSPGQVEDLLYTKSGLLGISGISSDMRDLLGSHDPAAKLAVDYFVYRAAREIGGLAAVLGGLDALVFTGGIGENSAEIRARIVAASAWLGMRLDARANAAGGPCISDPASRVSAWVIPTNEELLIARQTRRLLGLG